MEGHFEDDAGTPLLDDIVPPPPDNVGSDPAGSTPTMDDVPVEEIPAPTASLVRLDSLASHEVAPDQDRETPVEDENPEPPLPSSSPHLSPVSLASLEDPIVPAEGGGNEDDISSLSGFSSPEEDRKNPDLEDGEIRAAAAAAAAVVKVNGSASKSGQKRGKNNYRNRRSPSPNKSPVEKRRHKRELPRYDVRNVIERKRRRGHKSYSRSRSRSFSPSRSRSWSRPGSRMRTKSRSRTRSRSRSRDRRKRKDFPLSNKDKKKKKKQPRYSRSPSPRKRNWRSPSPSPRIRNRRSPSPPPPARRMRYSRSPSFDRKRHYSSDEPRPKLTKIRDKTKKRKAARSPEIVEVKSKKKKKTKNLTNGGQPAAKAAKKTKRKVIGIAAEEYAGIHSSSNVIAEKEVFASGDKIMVSVNFKKTGEKAPAAKGTTTKETPKPSVVIDVMSSPYQVIEQSPKEVIDVFSDEENETKKKSPSPAVMAIMEEPPSKNLEDPAASKNNVDEVQELPLPPRGPCTPPSEMVENFDLTRGPQTPTEDPSDSYDPCDPTESPELETSTNGHQNGNGTDADSLLKTVVNSIPFLLDDDDGPGGDGGSVGGGGGGGSDKNDLPVDMDMDSPFSPQSSDMSDIFEPPLNTPLTNKKIAAKRPGKNSNARQQKNVKSKNKHIHMKIVDDQLRIIDDVPTSAVEMAVKEKFLKKVQRQERIVEEIKMVLKPHYNRKRIGKEEYKDILRKCVPKVCHSKKGDINPLKIQKLVKGYVKKYQHARKRSMNMSS